MNYEEIKEGYWVYSIKIPSNNKYYIGVSRREKCSQRWQKALYGGTVLKNYLDEWDSLIKTVIQDGLTREEALKMEDDLIQALRFIDLCVNEQRSGLISVSDKNAYARELLKNNTELSERNKQRAKQWYEDNKEHKKQHYENNKEQILEQHKQRYDNNTEYREHKNKRCKQYYENNKEKVLEQQKQYYQKNKEKISERRKQQYQKKKLEKEQNK